MTARFYDRVSSISFFFALAAMIAMLCLHFYLPHLARYWGGPPFSAWQMWLIRAANATRSFVWFAGTVAVFSASIGWRFVAASRLRRSAHLRGFEVAPATRAP